MLSLIAQDTEHVLQPVAQLLSCLPQGKARKALLAAARRSLRLAAQDRAVSMRTAEKEASAIVDRLQPANQSGQIVRRLRRLRAA
jgi:hypothetical protein